MFSLLPHKDGDKLIVPCSDKFELYLAFFCHTVEDYNKAWNRDCSCSAVTSNAKIMLMEHGGRLISKNSDHVNLVFVFEVPDPKNKSARIVVKETWSPSLDESLEPKYNVKYQNNKWTIFKVCAQNRAMIEKTRSEIIKYRNIIVSDRSFYLSYFIPSCCIYWNLDREMTCAQTIARALRFGGDIPGFKNALLEEGWFRQTPGTLLEYIIEHQIIYKKDIIKNVNMLTQYK